MTAPATLKAAKNALVDILAALPAWADVVVFNGPCGTFEPDDYCEILGSALTEDRARMGTARKRWYNFAITGRLSTYAGGGDEAQQTVTDRALDLLEAAAVYLQDAGTVPSTQTSLGGVVQWARLTSFDENPELEDIAQGRKTYIDFTISGQFVA